MQSSRRPRVRTIQYLMCACGDWCTVVKKITIYDGTPDCITEIRFLRFVCARSDHYCDLWAVISVVIPVDKCWLSTIFFFQFFVPLLSLI